MCSHSTPYQQGDIHVMYSHCIAPSQYEHIMYSTVYCTCLSVVKHNVLTLYCASLSVVRDRRRDTSPFLGLTVKSCLACSSPTTSYSTSLSGAYKDKTYMYLASLICEIIYILVCTFQVMLKVSVTVVDQNFALHLKHVYISLLSLNTQYSKRKCE